MNRSAPIFSPVRIWAMAWNTLVELTRMKIFYFLLIFALLTIGTSFYTTQLNTDEQFQLLKDVSLGSMSIFTSLIAILATALLLPKDLEDRTTFTILAKPVPRYEYLAGKLLGILLLLALSIVIMSVLFLSVLWMRQQTALAPYYGPGVTLTPDELAHEIGAIHAATFNANLVPGIVIIFVKSALLASLTLMISTFATTSIFTMMMSIAVYFIGHLQATAREYWLDAIGVQWWTKPFLAIVSLLFPDLQIFSLTDDVVAGVPIHASLFLQTTLLGVFYIGVYYLLACFFFSNREL